MRMFGARRGWVSLAAAAFLVSSFAAGDGAAAAEEEYATRTECIEKTFKPCYETDQGTWIPDSDPRTGGEVRHDEEFLARSARTMKSNVSGTLQTPVVAVDFEQVTFPDVQPELDLAVQHVRVPIRFVSEKIGAKVSWEQSTKTVTIEKEGRTITLQVGNPTVWVNGVAQEFNVPPILKNDRVLVPLRYIAQMYGATVDWVGGEPPAVYPSYVGRYQVWIWIPSGYWGATGLEERLQTFMYRRD